jgi:hypothetical protein
MPTPAPFFERMANSDTLSKIDSIESAGEILLHEMGNPRLVPIFERIGEATPNQFRHMTSKNLDSHLEASAP